MNIKRFKSIDANTMFVFATLMLLVLGCSSSETTLKTDTENQPDQPNGELSDVEEILESTIWRLVEASDEQGRTFELLEPAVYILIFYAIDGVYEHTVYCQPYRGFYSYQDSILEISSSGAYAAADCAPIAVTNAELDIFLPEFYTKRTLMVDLSNDSLLLRGVNNDFLRYERCTETCFNQF